MAGSVGALRLPAQGAAEQPASRGSPAYAGWLGRSRAAWARRHRRAGTPQAAAAEPPDVLLTTPESLEAMLVSTLVDPERIFADLRAVVVDEVHAFAGRRPRLAPARRPGAASRVIAGRPLQRIGLSATVGNPAELLAWLQGGAAGRSRPRSVVAPECRGSAIVRTLSLDYVGSVANAAKVLAALHRGEKRLVFADSRRTVESLAVRAAGERGRHLRVALVAGRRRAPARRGGVRARRATASSCRRPRSSSASTSATSTG